ncbi:Hypothetical predicted protein [Cloeon dipterum]|uniref:Uncharacterized protein n=1 Tax=Cloeon dipterum TaxID=197152 RepID=A0A8S1DBS1_9INSE|nr:Hypothetical predicted protein [Cloeon dipterum]
MGHDFRVKGNRHIRDTTAAAEGDTTAAAEGDTTAAAEGDTTVAGGDTTEAGGDTTVAGGDTTESGGDTTAPPAEGDTTAAADGETTVPSDTPAAFKVLNLKIDPEDLQKETRNLEKKSTVAKKTKCTTGVTSQRVTSHRGKGKGQRVAVASAYLDVHLLDGHADGNGGVAPPSAQRDDRPIRMLEGGWLAGSEGLLVARGPRALVTERQQARQPGHSIRAQYAAQDRPDWR